MIGPPLTDIFVKLYFVFPRILSAAGVTTVLNLPSVGENFAGRVPPSYHIA